MKGKSKDLYDLTIIGGGPAGLFASFYAGLREMKVKIIEAQPYLGGKVHVYPEKMIWDVGGLTPIAGNQFIKQTVEQGMTFDPTIALNQTVNKIKRNEKGIFELVTNRNKSHYSKAILLAVGGGIIDPMKLDVESASLYENSNLHYKVTSIKDFKDKKILISGGGPSAVDWANEIAPIAKQVILIYRGEQLKSHEADITKLSHNKVVYFTNTEISELLGDEDQVNHVRVVNNQTNKTTTFPVDAILVNHGYDRNQSLLKNSRLDVQLVEDYFIEGNPKGESSIAGLYAAGDILHYEGKLHLIAGAFQDAVNAVNCAKLHIEPEAHEMALVSSHNDRLEEKNKQYIYG